MPQLIANVSLTRSCDNAAPVAGNKAMSALHYRACCHLRVYYSRIGDRPERILVSETRLTDGWQSWRASAPTEVLTPERDYEGASLPLEVSAPDEAPGRVRQLRDPAIFMENGRTYLLYSVAGESGLAIGELRQR
jgi:hypothetical protein